MKSLFTLTACFFFSIHLMAQTQAPFTISIWPDGIPNSNGITEKEQQNEEGRISLVSQPTITVYRPASPNGMTIIACPGGGYIRLAMDHEGYDMATWFNSLGITYVVLKYRMPNGHHEIPLSDAEQAMRLVRQHAKEWNINPNRIGIMGASAGGHLASTLATHYSDNSSRPDFQILLYPVITMDQSYTHGGSRKQLLGDNPSQELVDRYSNEKQVNQQTPQAFIVLSSDDQTVPPANGVNYYLSLVRHRVPVTLHAYPTVGHGWGFRDNFIYKREWTGKLEKWLSHGLQFNP